jgi:hypothetical protein
MGEHGMTAPPPDHTLVIACATVIEEMLPLMPPGMGHQVLDFGLHVTPNTLRQALQAAVDAASAQYDTLLLGYGLCSRAVIGLRAPRCTLVVPKVDDCIAIFLGSKAAYTAQSRAEPGTYYLTKGWIEVADTPFAEYDRVAARYGRERADRLIKVMLKSYTRLALINTGHYELERYREYARGVAARFGLRFEEIEGATGLIKKMLYGPWDDEFVVVPPGGEITFEMFFSPAPTGPAGANDG